MKRLLLAFLFVPSLAAAQNVPRLLIVQSREPLVNGVDLNLPVGDLLAQEAEGSSLVAPIVWTMADPVFRSAVLEGTLQNPPESPSLNEALVGAGRLRAEYTLWLTSSLQKDRVKGTARLFRGRREVWKDEKSIAVTVGSENKEMDGARSIARTWMLALTAGPFKGLTPRPKIGNPTLAPGQAPPPVEPPPTVTPPPTTTTTTTTTVPSTTEGTPSVPAKVDNDPLKKDLSAMLAGGRRNEAILRLRDAVDQEPLDAERRMLLISTLTEGDPALAAAEARRAAILFPEVSGLRLLAARAWLRAGNPEQARADLNEAIARDPNGSATRLMLAELALGEEKPEAALDLIDVVLKAGPNAEAFTLRALCRALLGGAEGASADLAEAKKLEPTPSPDDVRRRYSLSVRTLDSSARRAMDETRSLIQRARVRPNDQAVRDESERLIRQARARTAFLGTLTPPLTNRPSHERRLLAFRLLGQTLGDLQSYLTTPEEDLLTEAGINLGEAMKHAAGARETYAAEK